MTTMHCFRAVPLLALLGLGSCKKEEIPTLSLPAVTQSGQNTAGGRVNGSVWLPVQQFLFAGKALAASYHKSVTGFQLNLAFSRYPAEGNDPFSETIIRFYVPDIRTPGPVVLNQAADPTLTTSNPAYATFTYAQPRPDQVLITGPVATGQLLITRLDTVAHIVAGTYEFQAKEVGGSNVINVTEGRFDLTY